MTTRTLLRVALTAAVALTAGHRSAAQPPLGGGPGASQATTLAARVQVISTGGGGLNVNSYLGANAFYAAGYTGTRSVMVNIEGHHLWNGHETLQHVTQFITGPGGNTDPSGHPTGVAHMMGGRPTGSGNAEQQRGVAYGATLWSGAIATSPPTSSSYTITFRSFFQPYLTAFQTGIGGVRADVANGSWGDDTDASAGRTVLPRALDALATATGKVMVFAAGNSGPGPNTVIAPATGYNVISVAALGPDTSNPPYNAPSGFSSRGPQDVFIPTGSANGTTGSTVTGGRIRVDIAAPGQDLVIASMGGVNDYTFGGSGTSYASPLVAGGVALMIDAGRALSLTNSADIRVVKAVLLTSADKTAGWDNGQAVSGGVVRTTQALDQAVGAGRMNLARALPIYADPASTRDVSGTTFTTPASVAARGYDYAAVVRGTTNDYRLPDSPLASTLAVTLTWLADRGMSDFNVVNPTDADFFDNRLANLNLQVYRLNAAGDFDTLVAESTSLYNNTEHLFLTDLPAGRYGLRVLYPDDVWNFTPSSNEFYGLAWNQFAPVPEPTGILAVVVVATFAVRLVRRRKSATAGNPPSSAA